MPIWLLLAEAGNKNGNKDTLETVIMFHSIWSTALQTRNAE